MRAFSIYSKSVLFALISLYLHLDFTRGTGVIYRGFISAMRRCYQHPRIADHSHYLQGIVTMTDTHCIAVSFDPEVHAADNRRLKVGYASRYPDYSRLPVKYVQFPSIVMKGQWLKAAGFDTGTRVDVRVMQGCIVLTAQTPQPEESALMKSLRKVEKLSARKQKQVLEFIAVIAGKGSKG